MSRIIIIPGYNNYYNRIIKKLDSVASYLALPGVLLLGVEIVDGVPTGGSINFNEADGVNTSHCFKIPDNVTWNNPDYCVVADENNNIISRWFIIESTHLSGHKKYQCALRRDLFVDYFDQINNAAVYVEKGMVKRNNPFILNSEKLPVNQIKKSETLLKDGSGVGWYVAYLAKNLEDASHVTHNQVTFGYKEPANYIEPDNDFINNWFSTEPKTVRVYKEDTNTNLQVNLHWLYPLTGAGVITELNSPFLQNSAIASDIRSNLVVRDGVPTNEVVESIQSAVRILSSDIISFTCTKNELQPTMTTVENGSIIKYNDKFYRVSILKTGTGNVFNELNPGVDTICSDIDDELTHSLFTYDSFPSNKYAYWLTTVYEEYEVGCVELSEYELTFTIPLDRNKTNAQYDIIAVPQAGLQIGSGEQEIGVTLDGKELINAIATQLGTFVYDVQLLPYCPIPDVAVNGVFLYEDTEMVLHKDYDFIETEEESFEGFLILYPREPSFTISIAKSLQLDPDITEDEYKAVNDCDYYRLVSPTYNGQFDINIAKNKGIDHFIVSCLYQPNIPFIYLRPNFKGLYGGDFTDNRGLICSGDFSLPRVDDKFIDYQLQNKNYQNIFDRQIQNLDTMRKYQKFEEYMTSFAGAFGGGAQGAMTGATIGGAAGAVVGGVLGTAFSSLGGALDMQLSEKRFLENKDFAIDNYNMQLDNIKALPYSITKVNPLTPSNKIFPFIEFYTCTEQERQAFKDKIKYDGMTIGAIGKMKDYEPGYFKGQLIRIEISEDTHLVQEIALELMKGVYK